MSDLEAIVTDSWEGINSQEVTINVRIGIEDAEKISGEDLSAVGRVETSGTEIVLPDNLGGTGTNTGSVTYNVKCGPDDRAAWVGASLLLLLLQFI